MPRNHWRTSFRAALLFLGASAALAVDTTSSNWDSLSALRPGDSVQIVDDTLKSWEGSFLSVSPEEIAVRVDQGFLRSGEKRLRRESVFRVSRIGRGRNTLIGLGAGLAAGAAISAWATQRIDKGYGGALSKGQTTALFLGVLGGAGAGIGYAIPHLETLYRRPSAKPASQ